MITSVCVEGVHRITIHPETNRREDIIGAVSKALNLSPTDFYLTQNGKLINSGNVNISSSAIHVCMRLAGGKGGFGSMLRAIGAQIEKTTNREACRDLSGRRLRDINEEKRMKEYLDKKANEEEEASSKIAKKIERLRSKPKHEFKDDEYFEARSNLLEDVSDALEKGFKNQTATSTSGISLVYGSNENTETSTEAGSSGVKRKTTKTGKKQKKKLKGAQWLDDGLSSDDPSSSNDESSDESNDKSVETKSKPQQQQQQSTSAATK